MASPSIADVLQSHAADIRAAASTVGPPHITTPTVQEMFTAVQALFDTLDNLRQTGSDLSRCMPIMTSGTRPRHLSIPGGFSAVFAARKRRWQIADTDSDRP